MNKLKMDVLVYVGIVLGSVWMAYSALYGSNSMSTDDRFFGCFIALCIPSIGATASYYLLKEHR